MAINPVTIMEMLRPWRDAGITHMYMPEGIAIPGQEQAPAHVAQPSSTPVPQDGRPTNSTTTTQPQRTPLQRETPKAKPQTSSATESKKEFKKAVTPPSLFQTVAPNIHTETWPECWRNLHAQTHAAPILWTYSFLGEDFFGNKSEERSFFLRKLVGTLKLPKGTSMFWPHTNPGKQQELQAQPALFSGAVSLFDPQIIILLGPSCVQQLGFALHITLPFTQQIGQGRLFLLLPELDDMIKNATLFEQAIIFLSAILRNKPQLLIAKE